MTKIETVDAEIVKEYTKDDFAFSTEPYAELYKYAGSPFEHCRKQYELEEKAKKVGFTSFKSFYKNYRESLEKERKGELQYMSNPTEFSGQPLQLESGTWKCSDSGIIGYGEHGEFYACHHPILPIEVLENIDTGEEKLKLAYRKRGVWREIIVSKSVLYNSRKIIELSTAGVDVTSESAKSLVAFLQDMENLNIGDLPVKQSVGRLGYIGGAGFAPYVDGLIFDGEAAFSTLYSAISEHGDYQTWLDQAIACRKMSLTARIILSASFASVLISHIGGLPFFVHLWGVDSGTGKTVGLMLAASVWGNPEMGKYIQTFNATQVGQERIAAFLNNLPFLIDELQLSKDSHGKSRFDVYQLSQGVGRNRGNKVGGIDRTPTWSNCILTTGESPLTSVSSGAGAVNRVIDIECTAGDAVITDGASVSGVLKRNYGFAGKMFVGLLEKDSVKDYAKKCYAKFFADLSATDTTEKQSMAAAMILTADKLATEYIFKDGKVMTADQMSGFLQSKASVSLGERGYKYMCDWVAVNANKFRSDNETGEIYGVISDNWAFIIRSVFEKAAEDKGYNCRALLSWLKSNDKIQTRGKHMTRPKRMGSKAPVECVVLRLPDDNYTPEELENIGDGVPF